MRFLIAGSSGFLGTQLRETLHAAGHPVRRLVRGEPKAADQLTWAPYDEPLDPSALEDVDVVVNLAGAPTAGNPHSERWARELERSRVTTTRVLAEAIAASRGREDGGPVFLAGNGISVYGDHGQDRVDESSASRGNALLTRVCHAWEAAAQPAVDAGARVVVLRTSPVLDRRSAPLSLMLPLFRAGVGGRLGSGAQYFPTISADDWVGAVLFAAEHETVSGPVNLTIPQPATNAELTEALGAAVHRPTVLKVPAFVIRPAAGRMAPELLGSLRAEPKALLDAGYTFRHPDITTTVAAALTAGR